MFIEHIFIMRYKDRSPVLEAFAILQVDVGEKLQMQKLQERSSEGDTEEEVVTFILRTGPSQMCAISA